MEFWLPLILIGVVVVVMVALGVVLRRRRAAAAEEPPEIGSPTDYTSLPIEEPTGWRERFANLSVAGKALLVLVPLLVIVGAVVLVLALSSTPTTVATPQNVTPVPAPAITITSARLINEKTIAIRADSTLPPDTPVQAALLANNEPFAWFESSTASAKAGTNGEIDVRLTKLADAPRATEGVSYTVALRSESGGKTVESVSALNVPSIYARSFYEQPAVAEAPTATPAAPTATIEAPTAAPAKPTATTEAPATPALTASVFNGGNVRDQPRVSGSKVLDQINAGETVQLLQKTADGRWYQIQNIRAVVGWVNVTLLNPVASDIASQIPAQGSPPLPTAAAFATPAPQAAQSAATATPAAPLPTLPSGLSAGVFNGGNVRDQPQVSGSKVLDQVNAGETVQLLQKTGNGGWYQIRNQRAVVGWVNVTLLTIDPTVAAKVPVAPGQ